MWGISSSLLGVVPFVPPFLLSRSAIKSSTLNGNPAGQPSMVTPTHSPCDSPKICTRNMRPKLFMRQGVLCLLKVKLAIHFSVLHLSSNQKSCHIEPGEI